jgi:hypothetical protein
MDTVGPMLLYLRRRIADIVDPEWRKSPLIASLLEHEIRLRADPEHRRLRARIDAQSRKELVIMSLGVTGALLALALGAVCAVTKASPDVVITWPTVQELAVTIIVSSIVSLMAMMLP